MEFSATGIRLVLVTRRSLALPELGGDWVDSSYVSEARQECLVSSCSECCMQEIDGKPNIKGALHRAEYTKPWGLDCAHCPITLRQSQEEWAAMLAAIDGIA